LIADEFQFRAVEACDLDIVTLDQFDTVQDLSLLTARVCTRSRRFFEFGGEVLDDLREGRHCVEGVVVFSPTGDVGDGPR
jgi:hypothetical protein